MTVFSVTISPVNTRIGVPASGIAKSPRLIRTPTPTIISPVRPIKTITKFIQKYGFSILRHGKRRFTLYHAIPIVAASTNISKSVSAVRTKTVIGIEVISIQQQNKFVTKILQKSGSVILRHGRRRFASNRNLPMATASISFTKGFFSAHILTLATTNMRYVSSTVSKKVTRNILVPIPQFISNIPIKNLIKLVPYNIPISLNFNRIAAVTRPLSIIHVPTLANVIKTPNKFISLVNMNQIARTLIKRPQFIRLVSPLISASVAFIKPLIRSFSVSSPMGVGNSDFPSDFPPPDFGPILGSFTKVVLYSRSIPLSFNKVSASVARSLNRTIFSLSSAVISANVQFSSSAVTKVFNFAYKVSAALLEHKLKGISIATVNQLVTVTRPVLSIIKPLMAITYGLTSLNASITRRSIITYATNILAGVNTKRPAAVTAASRISSIVTKSTFSGVYTFPVASRAITRSVTLLTNRATICNIAIFQTFTKTARVLRATNTRIIGISLSRSKNLITSSIAIARILSPIAKQFSITKSPIISGSISIIKRALTQTVGGVLLTAVVPKIINTINTSPKVNSLIAVLPILRSKAFSFAVSITERIISPITKQYSFIKTPIIVINPLFNQILRRITSFNVGLFSNLNNNLLKTIPTTITSVVTKRISTVNKNITIARSQILSTVIRTAGKTVFVNNNVIASVSRSIEHPLISVARFSNTVNITRFKTSATLMVSRINSFSRRLVSTNTNFNFSTLISEQFVRLPNKFLTKVTTIRVLSPIGRSLAKPINVTIGQALQLIYGAKGIINFGTSSSITAEVALSLSITITFITNLLGSSLSRLVIIPPFNIISNITQNFAEVRAKFVQVASHSMVSLSRRLGYTISFSTIIQNSVIRYFNRTLTTVFSRIIQLPRERSFTRVFTAPMIVNASRIAITQSRTIIESSSVVTSFIRRTFPSQFSASVLFSSLIDILPKRKQIFSIHSILSVNQFSIQQVSKLVSGLATIRSQFAKSPSLNIVGNAAVNLTANLRSFLSKSVSDTFTASLTKIQILPSKIGRVRTSITYAALARSLQLSLLVKPSIIALLQKTTTIINQLITNISTSISSTSITRGAIVSSLVMKVLTPPLSNVISKFYGVRSIARGLTFITYSRGLAVSRSLIRARFVKSISLPSIITNALVNPLSFAKQFQTIISGQIITTLTEFDVIGLRVIKIIRSIPVNTAINKAVTTTLPQIAASIHGKLIIPSYQLSASVRAFVDVTNQIVTGTNIATVSSAVSVALFDTLLPAIYVPIKVFVTNNLQILPQTFNLIAKVSLSSFIHYHPLFANVTAQVITFNNNQINKALTGIIDMIGSLTRGSIYINPSVIINIIPTVNRGTIYDPEFVIKQVVNLTYGRILPYSLNILASFIALPIKLLFTPAIRKYHYRSIIPDFYYGTMRFISSYHKRDDTKEDAEEE